MEAPIDVYTRISPKIFRRGYDVINGKAGDAQKRNLDRDEALVKNTSDTSVPGAPLGVRRRRREVSGAKPFSGSAMLAVAVVVIAALYFARNIFVPLALAILLSFALGPLVMRLRRWHFGRVPSVIVTVLLAFVVIFGVGTLIGSQLTQLADELPQYQINIIQKIQSIRGIATGSGVVGRASEMLQELGSEMAKTTEPADNAARAPFSKLRSAQGQQPIPVEIHEPGATPFSIIENVVGPLLQPLATAGIVIVFVIFFLLQREDLRDRFIRLVGSGDLRRTTEALDDAVGRLSRYLLMQTAINTTFGLLIGTGLWLIGVPYPVLWGVLAMLLRFVPYIGPVIAGISPVALALAVDPGWSMPLWTASLFLVAEPMTGQVVEPFLYSHSTGLSAVAVVVAAVFWTWLWGPVGLFLSTPLTLCLVVLGRHVARLDFLDVLFGDKPALTLEENFYQRMLANDPDEAAHQAEAFLKDKPLSAYYDEVAIKGLGLAQWDVNRGELDHERRVQIKEAVDGVIDDLSDHASLRATPAVAGSTGEELPNRSQNELAPGWGGSAVLCIAGRGSLDEAAAAMLAQLLTNEGIGVRIVPSEAVSAPNMLQLDVTGVQMACLSYLEPGDFANARYLVRRLRRKLPGTPIVVGFWTLSEDDAKRRNALVETGADGIVTSLRHAAEHVSAVAKTAIRRPETAPKVASSAAE
ncbi:MAG TPA: AI-2E family transporter [Stellaceae bacterium]|nr:AI-2E family transporter [Stellaceae bacterium]